MKDRVRLRLRMVTTEFFEALGYPIAEGRTFNRSDDLAGVQTVLINQRAKSILFPQESTAIGQTLVLDVPRRVVGVTADAKLRTAELDPEPEAYIPLFQTPLSIGSLVLLPEPAEASVVAPLRVALMKEYPDVAIARALNVNQELENRLAPRRMGLWTLVTAAALASLLALVGLVGTIAVTISARLREVSIRIALGQPVNSIIWLLGRQSALLLALGLVLGWAFWGLVSPIISSHLVGLQIPKSGAVFGSASLLFTAGLAATLLMARNRVVKQSKCSMLSSVS